MSVVHTKPTASRFSPGYLLSIPHQFPILYLTENPQTALYEIGSMLGTPLLPGRAVPHPSMSTTLLNVTVKINLVADLSSPAEQSRIDMTVQELTGDWMGYQHRSALTSVKVPTGIPAPTQELGFALSKTGMEGFLTVSARVPTDRNLVVFPGNLQSGSFVEFTDTSTGRVHTLKK